MISLFTFSVLGNTQSTLFW